MALHQFTDRTIVKLLATQTRRVDLTAHALSRSHVALGRFLAGELVERLPVAVVTIQHPQGEREGFALEGEEALSIVCFMRAGLYVAEGVREILERASLHHVSPRRGAGLEPAERAALGDPRGRCFVLVDSVINTGASLEPLLSQLVEGGASAIFVLALVSPVPTADRLAAAWPQVDFFIARTSTNQYVGRGATDTGNRLFGTVTVGVRQEA